MHSRRDRAASLRQHLVNDLVARRHLRTAQWKDAFRHVPRHAFLHHFDVPTGTGLARHDLDAAAFHDAALAAAYTDNPLITQWAPTGTATSSSSAPSLMADMLEHLEADPGHRVLEIGTGPGYNAALLSHALGDTAVTTVDIDAELVATAQRALTTAGYAPRIVCADGSEGVPSGAPYDRIIATCGLDRLPTAWLSQLRPGGRIVAALSYGLIVLSASDSGRVSGAFQQTPAGFMPLRCSSDDQTLTPSDIVAATNDCGPQRPAPGLGEGTLTDSTVQFLWMLHCPKLQHTIVHNHDSTEVRLCDPSRRAGARAVLHPSHADVARFGSVDLWDELVFLVTMWAEHGYPDISRYGLSVQPHGTHLLWLDEPHRVIAVLSRSETDRHE